MNLRVAGPGRGASLVEVIVAIAILGILTTTLFAMFKTGVTALRKVENQSELIRELQLLSLKITQEASESTYTSLSVSPDGHIVSFLSAVDSDGNFQANEFGRPVWQKFILYYYDTADSTIKRTVVDFTPPTPTDSRTLETYSGDELTEFIGTGDPVPVGHRVAFCRWKSSPPALLNFEFVVEKQRHQGRDMETKSLASTVKLRN
jgi:prepilin-type N-terminal cleavage/methylation domain-containing protein